MTEHFLAFLNLIFKLFITLVFKLCRIFRIYRAIREEYSATVIMHPIEILSACLFVCLFVSIGLIRRRVLIREEGGEGGG